MIMTFYVQGRPEGEVLPQSDDSYLDSASSWVQDKASVISDLSFDEAVECSRDSGRNMMDKLVRAFKYLSGAPLPTPSLPPLPAEEKEGAKKQGNSSWGFAGIFSSLRTTKGATGDAPLRSGGQQFTEGEVHADLVKDKDGYFVFRYLLVDIPSSRYHNPVRIFVEREPGVRENEPVMRWISS